LIKEISALKERISDLELSKIEDKRMREVLPGSLEEYRNIFDNAMVGIFQSTPDGKYIRANAALAAIYGYSSPDELMNTITNIGEQLYVDPEDRRRYMEYLDKNDVMSGYEMQLYRKDGSKIWISMNVRVVRNPDGSPAYYEGIVEDIAERRRAEEALRWKTALLEAQVNTSIDAILVVDENHNTLLSNQRFVDLWEISRHILDEGNDAARLKHIAAQVRDPDEFVEKIMYLYDHPQETSRDEIETRSGMVLDRYSAPVVGEDGHHYGRIWTFRDITERKRAEEQLRESQRRLADIIEFLPDATLAIDQEGKIIAWNRAIEAMTGVSKEHMLGKGDYEYALPFYGTRRPILINFVSVWDEDIEKQYSFIKRDGDTLFTETDVPFVRGQKRSLWGKAGPLYDIHGNVAGAIESIRDVTERKILEAQLMNAQKMEAIGTLSGGVAHDFNNILMGVQGYASLMMLDTDKGHPHYEWLGQIEELVRNAADLTRQLLGFARGGKYVVKPFDMNELIEKTSTMFGRTRKEVVVHRKYQNSVWTVEGDHGQIEQVLLNLYLNAWQAMPSGGDLVLETRNVVLDDVGTKTHSMPPGRYVCTCITDSGVGMDARTKERIFEPFFTTKELGRGTGLGLAMVYGIIKNHNGHINVESEPGKGTTFCFCLPASQKDIEELKPGASEIVRGRGNILLVDDEATILAVSTAIIESLGYTVDAVRSGEEAIALYRKKKDTIDLVVLDMIMPGLSGNETFDRIREINPGARVILCSGYSLNEQAYRIMEKGCGGFLQKPFNITQISRKLREVLQD